MPLPDHTMRLMVQGETRGILVNVIEGADYQMAQFAEQSHNLDDVIATVENRAQMRVIGGLAKQVAKQRGNAMPELMQAIESEKMPGVLCDCVANSLLGNLDDKQQVLECFDINMRLELLAHKIGTEISAQVSAPQVEFFAVIRS